MRAFVACTDQKSEPDAEPGLIIGIAVFRKDGSYRYYDYPPEQYYKGTYTYDAATQSLSMRTHKADYGSDPERLQRR